MCVTLVVLTGVWAGAEERASKTRRNLWEENVEGWKKYFKFEEWGGKTKGEGREVEKLCMDESFFNIFSRETKIYSEKTNKDKHLNVTIRDLASDLDVSIVVGVLESPLIAHERMIRGMCMATAPGPNYKRADPNDPNDPLNIGDVCFGPARPWIPKESGKEVLHSLRFCRNNVLVHLRNSLTDDAETYPDLRRIALLIDAKLLGRPITAALEQQHRAVEPAKAQTTQAVMQRKWRIIMALGGVLVAVAAVGIILWKKGPAHPAKNV
jgi:hypothetical protein